MPLAGASNASAANSSHAEASDVSAAELPLTGVSDVSTVPICDP